MNQQTDDWHLWRRKGLGSSDASVVMGVDPYRNREDLLLEKTGRGKPIQVNEAMRLGLKFEGAARAILFLELDLEFTPHTCTHHEFSYLKASLDGFNEERNLICEIKYMGRKNFDKVKNEKWPLDHHYPQVQHQLLVKGVNDALYVPYILAPCKTKIEDIEPIPVVRNDAYINDQLLPALQSFWGEVTEWIAKNQQLTL